MAKHVVWKVGDLVNIKLRDDLYTIGQMLTSPSMRFYDIYNNTGEWKNINLNDVKPLFRVMVVNSINKYLIDGKVKDKTVFPSDLPYEPYWIRVYLLGDTYYSGKQGDFPYLGGKLIDMGPDGSMSITKAPTVKENLRLPQDCDIIEETELELMWSHESLGDRLRRYFDTGINRDDMKFEVFPDLWNDREKLRPLTRRLPVPYR